MTVCFFIRKSGEFKFRPPVSSDADCDQEEALQEKLNHEEIDREFSKVSLHQNS